MRQPGHKLECLDFIFLLFHNDGWDSNISPVKLDISGCDCILFWSLTIKAEFFNDAFFMLFESVLMRWMKLEPIIQSEVSQKEKHQSDQIRSVAQSCLTLCDPMNRSTPGLPGRHQLLEIRC